MNGSHLLSRIGQFMVLSLLTLAVVAAILAPLLATQWSSKSFPGFLVEQSLVVTDASGPGWSGLQHGIHYPMRIIKIDNYLMRTVNDFQRFFADATVGRSITVYTIQPDGVPLDFTSVKVMSFSTKDLSRLFWLPYGIGLVYLSLGIWVFARRGSSAAGRAFTYAASSAAIVNMLLFNIWTGHQGVFLWTFALAQLGGAIIVLAFLLPDEIPSLAGKFWFRIFPYGISLFLAIWGIVSIAETSRPWAYIIPWRFSYYYTGFGLVIFVLSMIVRLRSPIDPLPRQQVRIILVGSLLAFSPVAIWLLIQLIHPFPYNTLFYSPLLLFFPLSIATAMVRFRLWDFDLVIRRTIIYTILTVLLVIIYLGFVVVMDRAFDRYLGDSNVFNVAATIVIVLIFTPLRKLVQRMIDRRLYRNRIRAERRIQAFAERLRLQMEIEQLSEDLIRVTSQTVNPSTISLWITKSTNENGGENV